MSFNFHREKDSRLQPQLFQLWQWSCWKNFHNDWCILILWVFRKSRIPWIWCKFLLIMIFIYYNNLLRLLMFLWEYRLAMTRGVMQWWKRSLRVVLVTRISWLIERKVCKMSFLYLMNLFDVTHVTYIFHFLYIVLLRIYLVWNIHKIIILCNNFTNKFIFVVFDILNILIQLVRAHLNWYALNE